MNTKTTPELNDEQETLRWERWRHIIYASEYLAAIQENPNPKSFQEIVKCLESIEEVFPKILDPIEDLEEYALRQFVKSLKSTLLILNQEKKSEGTWAV